MENSETKGVKETREGKQKAGYCKIKINPLIKPRGTGPAFWSFINFSMHLYLYSF